MARVLEAKGILTGKIFLETRADDLRVETGNSPKGYVEWRLHAASIIKVAVGMVEELSVIDPALFPTPVSPEEWVDIQTKHMDALSRGTLQLYTTSRFQYFPGQKGVARTKYEDAELKRTEEELKRYRALERQRQAELRKGHP